MTNNIASPGTEYSKQNEGWNLIDDLLGGTRTMRAAGPRWLPQEAAENPLAYTNRVARSILFNGLSDTLNKISARPFAQPTETDQNSVNVDRMGSDLTTFAGQLYKEGLKYGRSHILVNFPTSTGATLADDGEAYFSLVSAKDLLDWETTYDADTGVPRLTMVKIQENEDRIRIITETAWQVYTREDNGEHVLQKEGEHSFGRVPFANFQVSDGFMTGMAPFENLAWLNLGHWQSNSDHRNILRFSRVPMIFRSGWLKTELDKPVIIGPAAVFSSESPDARMGFVEHTGAAIQAGLDDLERLEKQMEALGMQPLLKPNVEQTATGVNTSNDRSLSDAQKWARLLQATLTEAYTMAAEWKRPTKPIEPMVSVFMDFGITSGDAQLVLQAAVADLINQDTFIAEWKRRGILDESVDPEKNRPKNLFGEGEND